MGKNGKERGTILLLLSALGHKSVYGVEKHTHACVGTFMMSAYVNVLKSCQAFFCFSRMSIQIKHPKNDGLALLIDIFCYLKMPHSILQCSECAQFVTLMSSV